MIFAVVEQKGTKGPNKEEETMDDKYSEFDSTNMKVEDLETDFESLCKDIEELERKLNGYTTEINTKNMLKLAGGVIATGGVLYGLFKLGQAVFSKGDDENDDIYIFVD
ncbi:hypothetical protein RZR97_05270 [Hydrogenimonas thermophila]|uniref:hypothetical protein n=1 Tax=Hydrogenimonas thermophila TaxID=223786 RepID=UPI0029371A79|nr:hypothetical protein [Hydrogenimonas thermophila]WOE70985.1 hypothetical protein RZR91_05290 [Hydrogenimonas thermophila]WOE73503.1 hypothetical protein RZR97_05270 [Hydrogenimonas thermophila]